MIQSIDNFVANRIVATQNDRLGNLPQRHQRALLRSDGAVRWRLLFDFGDSPLDGD